MSAKNTIKDLRDLAKPEPKGEDQQIEEAVTKVDAKFNPSNEPKTEAPESEAQSHKPTFGESAEKPEKTEPEGDPTTPQTVDERLEELVREQKASQQNDPDRVQRESHINTTEDVLSPPKSRPHTIDPMTGQIHYAGDVAPLPGGAVAHETDGDE